MTGKRCAPAGLFGNGGIKLAQQGTVTAAAIHDGLWLGIELLCIEEWQHQIEERCPAGASENQATEGDVELSIQVSFGPILAAICGTGSDPPQHFRHGG